MHNYRFANFYNTFYQEATNQKLLNQNYSQIPDQFYIKQEEYKTPIRSGLKTGLMGLTGIAAIKKGIDWYGEGHKNYHNTKEMLSRSGEQYNRIVRDMLDNSRANLRLQLAGTGLVLGGGYLLGKTAKRFVKAINSANNTNSNNQLTTQYSPYNPYNPQTI